MSSRVFGERYRVVERIGTGGMAEVYRAHDELLGREVALKVLSERFSGDRAFVERFRREAQAAAGLSHPNIVSLYDYGSEGDTYYIVMELIDGRGLEQVIKEDAPLLPERAAELAGDVALALERAHGAGLVHRDVKPSNVMITSYGQTKVTDFGIVRALGDGEQTMTQTGMVIGTASYIAPEQAQGESVDGRTDIYALGCVLYEMLTGRPPFSGESPLAIAYKHVRENPVPPSQLNSDVPEALDAITMKALAKNPENRYQSAAEMREDLQRFVAGTPVHATPLLADRTEVAPAVGSRTEVIGREEEGWEEEGRSRAALYVLAALLILGLFALVAYLLASNVLGGKQVVVPDVVGLQVDEASRLLRQRGLEAEIDRRPSQKAINTVLAQDPEAREEADEGSTVVLTVSDGPRQVEVPDVVGLSIEEARDLIEEEGLEVGEVEREPHDSVEENHVIEQSPDAGEQADAGSEVELVVSTGPEPALVPSVIGQAEETAIDEIEAAGLTVQVLRQPSDSDEGTVIAQDPEAGTEVAPGDTVTITVSEGPEEQPMPDVTGEDADDAEAFLESDYGLVVDQVEEPCAEAIEPGQVCRQEPEAGEPVSEGDSATLYVQPGDAALPDRFAARWWRLA